MLADTADDEFIVENRNGSFFANLAKGFGATDDRRLALGVPVRFGKNSSRSTLTVGLASM